MYVEQVLHQDIVSRQHAVDALAEKAQILTSATPSGGKVGKFAADLQEKYIKLCAASKFAVDKYEVAMRDHQQYQDSYQEALDWLNLMRDKVAACSDTSGDKLSVQNKLERLKVSCENKVFRCMWKICV